METLQSLRDQIESAQELFSVVKTMKTMAAIRIRHLRQALASLTEYHDTIEMGLQILLRETDKEIQVVQPAGGQRLGAIVIGSDQGMVGRFNANLARYALTEMGARPAEPSGRKVLALGLRAAAYLEQAGQTLVDQLAVPNSVEGVTLAVQEILVHVEAWRTEQEIEHILLFFNSPASQGGYEQNVIKLLPLDAEWLNRLRRREWPTRVLPTFRLDWEQLLAELIQNQLFVTLYRALVASMTSENASRLSLMQVAEKNIEERLDDLNAQYHHLRQTSITSELLDVVAGFETLTG